MGSKNPGLPLPYSSRTFITSSVALIHLTKLKKLRMENGLRKSDENYAMLLAQIPRDKFRSLAIEEVEIKARMRPLIWRYRWITRWKKTFKNS
jgi:hypothetical protein